MAALISEVGHKALCPYHAKGPASPEKRTSWDGTREFRLSYFFTLSKWWLWAWQVRLLLAGSNSVVMDDGELKPLSFPLKTL